MWTYTAFILGKYCKKTKNYDELSFGEFARFVFDVLWREQNLIFHDGKMDLFEDLTYLKKLGIIELLEDENVERVKLKVKDKKKLDQVIRIVEDSGTLTGVKLLDKYTRKINSAIETVQVTPS